MQEVFLLEPAAASIIPIYTSQHGYPQAVFTPNSHLHVINWALSVEDADRFQLTVRDRSGQLLANIDWPGTAPFVFETSLAILTGGKPAVGSEAELAVWDLPKGQQLGHRDLCPVQDRADGPPLGLVAANRAGTKLAYIAAHTTALRIHDAVNLDVLGTIKADAGVISLTDTLIWSVYGWALLKQRRPQVSMGGACVELRFLQQMPGSDSFRGVLQLQVFKAPAFSPCGAFCCLFDDTRSTVMRIHDPGLEP